MKGMNFFMLVETIIKYWLEFFLGLIATGLGIACKKIYSLYKNEQKHQKTKEEKAFYDSIEALIIKGAEESRKGDEKLQSQINVMQGGILSIQGRSFKQECREFLRPDRQFSLEEFETLQEEYYIYKNLGGNHDGDVLFDLVKKKASNILIDDK